MTDNEYGQEYVEEREEEIGMWKNPEDEDLDNMYENEED